MWQDDAKRVGARGIIGLVRSYMVDSGFRAVVLYRVANALQRRGVRLLPGLIRNHCVRTTGADISPQASIGKGFSIAHSVGIVIGSGVVIGEHAQLFSGVVIGQRKSNAWPTIGDDVHIYAGAKVLGDVDVGNRSRIGANAVVLNDVPSGATVVGIPATQTSGSKCVDQPQLVGDEF